MFENVLQKFTGAKAADKSDSFKHLWRCSLSEHRICDLEISTFIL